MRFIHAFWTPPTLTAVLLSITPPVFAQDAAAVLINGNGFEITTDMIDAELRFRPAPQAQQLRRNATALRELIDDFYRREAIVAASQQERVWETPADAYRLERARKEELLAIMLDRQRTKILNSLPDFTAQAQEKFIANKARYQLPEMVSAAHILLMAKTDADQAKRRPEAEALLARARHGEDFSKLAKEFSEDKGSAASGGQLDYFPHGRMVPAFEQAAFALKNPGDISDIVVTPFGLHIIRLEGRRSASAQSFESVKSAIIVGLRQNYVREQLRDWYQRMTDLSQVTAHREAIDAYIKRTAEAREPALTIPGGDKR